MTNVSGLRIEDYQDIESVNFAEDRKKEGWEEEKNSYLSCTEQPGPCADANAVECGKTRRIYSGNTVDGGKSELRGDQCGKQQKKIRIPSSISIKN